MPQNRDDVLVSAIFHEKLYDTRLIVDVGLTHLSNLSYNFSCKDLVVNNENDGKTPTELMR